MQIFDSHCHLNLDPLYESWDQHWSKANEMGVAKSFLPGTTLESSLKVVQIARTDDNLFAGIAIHPGGIELGSDVALLSAGLEELFSEHQQEIAAIGETGLDYYWLKDDEHKPELMEKQQGLFKSHLDLAANFQVSVSIHVRDKSTPSQATPGNAYWDVISILKEFSDRNLKFVLHCASGPVEYLDEAVKLGAYIGFAGNITYPKADDLRTLLAATPKNRIMAETDAPYLPPQEFRGKICEPWMISKTVAYLQSTQGIEPALLFENANNFFTRSI